MASGRGSYPLTLVPETIPETNLAESISFLPSQKICTQMVWFCGDTQAHYDAAGTITKVYSNISAGTPLARVERTGDTTTSLEFQFHGLASNTIAAVANDGTINASFSYAPFGEVLEATNAGGATQGTEAHKRRFNDKFEDDISGLAYYGARYFDKTLIGWSQADPLYLVAPDAAQLSTPRRANIYAFSLNNSLRYLDPDGLDAKGPAPGIFSYQSEMESSAAGRAGNMAGDNWMQGCDAYWGSGWCSGGSGGSGGRSDVDYRGRKLDPCGGGMCQEDSDMVAKDAAVDGDGYSTAAQMSECKYASDCRAAAIVRAGWIIPGLVDFFTGLPDRLYAASQGNKDPRLDWDLFTLFAGGGMRQGVGGLSSGPIAGGRGLTILQSGGNKLTASTARALNGSTGRSLTSREWGRALESLKSNLGLANNHHGKVASTGDYLARDGTMLGNILDYLP